MLLAANVLRVADLEQIKKNHYGGWFDAADDGTGGGGEPTHPPSSRYYSLTAYSKLL